MAEEPNDAGQVVNDTTPTNEPDSIPADADRRPNPDERGKTTQTGDAGDVPAEVKERFNDDPEL